MMKKILMLVFIAIVFVPTADARPKEINGIVILKANGAVLGLVVVWVKGTSQGMLTGNDGHFDLNVNEGDTLEFSAKCFKTTELVVGPGNHYKAELQRSEEVESNNNGSNVSTLDPRKNATQD